MSVHRGATRRDRPPQSDDPTSTDFQRRPGVHHVCALNRSELVAERLAAIRRIDHRIALMSRLGEIQQSLIGAGKTDEADAVSDLVAEEIGDVLSLQDGRHPFAGVPDN